MNVQRNCASLSRWNIAARSSIESGSIRNPFQKRPIFPGVHPIASTITRQDNSSFIDVCKCAGFAPRYSGNNIGCVQNWPRTSTNDTDGHVLTAIVNSSRQEESVANAILSPADIPADTSAAIVANA